MRNFQAPPGDQRCIWTVALRGGGANDVAQCMRSRTEGDLCKQHAKMAARWSCTYCGGNDEMPPDHCADCSRPGNEAGAAAEAAYWAKAST